MGEKIIRGEDIKKELLGLLPEEIFSTLLEETCLEETLRPFYGDNIFRWLHLQLEKDPMEFSDIPKNIRDFLLRKFSIFQFNRAQFFLSKDGSEKVRLTCLDGNEIETVYLPYRGRRSVCVSSQVGCKWRCSFCYTGKMGFKRNLTAAEIVEQVYLFVRKYGPITHVVYMGMGEPLDNYEQVLRSIKLLNHPKGQNIGMRRITISTVGIIPSIERLLSEQIQVNLAISLHNPIPEERECQVPAEKIYPLKKLLPLLRRYYRITHRQITFEYVVLPGINDANRHVRSLVKILYGLDCKVNLIPYNMVGMSSKERKRHKSACTHFMSKLRQLGLNKVTIRSSRGLDISGACGQLGLVPIASN